MYLSPLKAAVVEALKDTFTDSYPYSDERARTLFIDIEFPVAQTNYPGIWVQYEDTAELSIAGINHTESTITAGVSGHPDQYSQWTRWRFFGTVTLTISAMSSFERDTIYDEVVRMFAFAKQNAQLSPFRTHIERNDLIAMNANFDDLRPFGDNAAPGTPWETDEFIYEKSISFNIQGEFTGDAATQDLVPLSKIEVQDYVEGQPYPHWPDQPDGFDRTQWH